MFQQRNVALVPFGFTRSSADRIARRMADASETMLYAAWYWWVEPIGRDDRRASKGPAPDGIVIWTTRGASVVALRFTWGLYWIAEAHLVRSYPSGVALPKLVNSGHAYDEATFHEETFWFAHECVPSGFA